MPTVTCPKCACQLQVKVSLASNQKNVSLDAPPEDRAEVGSLLQKIDMSALNDWEHGFVSDVRVRFEKWKDKINMSDKQMATLRKIAEGGF